MIFTQPNEITPGLYLATRKSNDELDQEWKNGMITFELLANVCGELPFLRVYLWDRETKAYLWDGTYQVKFGPKSS